MTPSLLSYTDLAIAALLVLLNAGLSLWLDMGVTRSLLIAGVRTCIQLLLVGLVLKTVFALSSIWLISLIVFAMLAAASIEVFSRQTQRFKGVWGLGIGATTTTIATLFITAIALITLQPDPWFAPEVVIPLTGIVLGSVMNGVSISLHSFNTSISSERLAIEAQLALGATRYSALKHIQQNALRGGLIPITNQMANAGIITLPGLMTGQILAGMAPFEAAKYQIFVLFLLAGGAGIGAIAATYLAVWRATDHRDRLRLDRFL